MPSNNWKQIEEIFQTALEQPSEERETYLIVKTIPILDRLANLSF